MAVSVAAVVGTVLLASGDSSTASANQPNPAERPEAQALSANVTAGLETSASAESRAEFAALRAVAMSGEFVTVGHFSRQDLIRAIATPVLAESLIAESSAQILSFQFEVDTSNGFEMIQAPVTSRVRGLDGGRVEVSVWSVVVVASAERGVGRESWQTSRLEMIEIDGVWLVDVWETRPGPAPAPSADLVFAAPSELAEPMSWAAVTDGGGD